MKRVDTRRPYGTITGMPGVAYEQDDMLFDAQGFQVGGGAELLARVDVGAVIATESVKLKADAEGEVDFRMSVAKDFLRKQLGAGPVDKSVLLREADINNVSWEDVKVAFAQLRGSAIKQKNSTLWKLSAEV